MAWPPQLPQIAAWNSRGPPLVRARLATARQDGHRCGSFKSPLLAKKACSPLEKVNSSEQSRQVRVRSWYTLSRSSCGVIRPGWRRGPPRLCKDRQKTALGSAVVSRSRLGPGTHVAENSVAVKRFGGRNLWPVPRFGDEYRITTLVVGPNGLRSLTPRTVCVPVGTSRVRRLYGIRTRKVGGIVAGPTRPHHCRWSRPRRPVRRRLR